MIAVVILLNVTLVSVKAWQDRDGLCEINMPRKLVVGWYGEPEEEHGRMFTNLISKNSWYTLRYQGTSELSGRPCDKWLEVSKVEFYRQMRDVDVRAAERRLASSDEGDDR